MRHAYLFTENLHFCIWGKRSCLILALIRLGTQTNCMDRDAARCANLPENVLRALISACADENVAFAWAAECGFADLVRVYVRKGVNIHAADDDAFCRAAFNGHYPVVRTLVHLGVNVQVRNNYGLRWAAVHRHFLLAKFLIQCGANVSSARYWAYSIGDSVAHSFLCSYHP